jgi:hypothetical protein
MIIYGPKQPSNDIDVFLEPFMVDMKILREEGVKMMDASLKKEFTLKAIIFVTITDYPGLFSLSGQIKGKCSCVVCNDDTCYTYLNASKKMVYFDDQNEPQIDKLERHEVQSVRYLLKAVHVN